MNLKGTLPALILQVLERAPLHGYAIAQEIKGRSKGVLDYKEGTLYPALHALENKGQLVSYEQTENGRTRRYYKLTTAGKQALATEREQWQEYSQAIRLVMEGA
jgi:PadR family transcriptional regulator PadR